ncbi:MAG: response regulator transcription factor [Gemmatimonadales bacterium]|nr:response regulator transcription factor [Gemmatimonadales bacterium]
MNNRLDQARILLLEDDPNLGLIIEESLIREGFPVTLCRDGQQGLDSFAGGEFDLCLVDVMMPHLDGFEFARQIRMQGDETPLIFLTARALTEDRVEGFRIGCDDYVTKPFSMEELLLRIQAVLRRANKGNEPAPSPELIELGDFIFHRPDRTLARGESVRQLTDREADLLELLCLHRDRTLERSFALRRIWGDDSYHAGRSMDVFISHLRKYLQDDPRVQIRTVHGQGFKLMIREDGAQGGR